MQTHFTKAQLDQPDLAEANGILRKCMQCGFCTATCPSYLLLGNENDSPRGRIRLIKDLLEEGEAARPEVVKHLDRCLSCLACMSTCPSGVNYMRLIDQARHHIEKTYRRPWADRLLRQSLLVLLPRPYLLRPALFLAGLAQPLTPLLRHAGWTRWASLLTLAKQKRPKAAEAKAKPEQTSALQLPQKSGRIMLLSGCVQSVLDPAINAATKRLLERLGYEVLQSQASSCCGALGQHMGALAQSEARAKRLIDEVSAAQVEALIITASGCGTTIKDYAHLLQHDPAYAEKAHKLSTQSFDISEFLARASLLEQTNFWPGRVSYHAPCSLQHGQKLGGVAQSLLRRAGFQVADIPEGHLCCGSAGVYNILQPELAQALGRRKLANIAATDPDLIATSNIGCISQLQAGTGIPLLHMVELLDWAYGGPEPSDLEKNKVKDHG